MKYPTTRFVFDRKNTATKSKAALIQIEILMAGKKKYVSTGVKVYKDQWNERSHVVNCNDMLDKNDRIDSMKSRIDGYIHQLMREDEPFDWDAFNGFLENRATEHETFLDYIRRRLDERSDIKASSKKSQKKILNSLESFGRIVTFRDLTKGNIADYYDEFDFGKTWNLWNYPDKDKKQSGIIDALVKSLNDSYNKLRK